MSTPSRESALADLRRSQDRSFETEGIPMVLALVSEVGDIRPATDPAVVHAGQQLAAGMDAYRNALLPAGRDDDLGSLVSVLQALSYADFGQPAAAHGASTADTRSPHPADR